MIDYRGVRMLGVILVLEVCFISIYASHNKPMLCHFMHIQHESLTYLLLGGQ